MTPQNQAQAPVAGIEAGVEACLAREQHLAALVDGVIDELSPSAASDR